jgi:hypothetical protein
MQSARLRSEVTIKYHEAAAAQALADDMHNLAYVYQLQAEKEKKNLKALREGGEQ